MAKQPGLDFQSAKGGLGELKRRLLFVIGALIVFRIGSFIPIPGIDAAVLAKLLEQQRGTIIEMFNMFSGGALSRASIFALGIMPYISASIIIQLLTVVHPTLAEIKKEGFCKLIDILNASETDLQKAHLIGPVRARTIYNSSMNAVLEYIIG